MTNGAHIASADQVDVAQSALRQAKQQLLKAKVQLDDEDFFDSLSQDEKAKAIDQSLRLSTTIVQIENAQIALIASQVEASSAVLRQATQDLQDALQSVQDIARLFNAVGSLLSIVLRVIAV